MQSQLLHSSQELQKHLSLLRGITEGTTDAVFVKDLQGRYLMMNSAGARFLGRSSEEVVGQGRCQLFTPDNGREIMERDRAVIQSGQTCTYEEVGGSVGRSRGLTLSTKGPYRDAKGRIVGLLGICARHHRSQTRGRGDSPVTAEAADSRRAHAAGRG